MKNACAAIVVLAWLAAPALADQKVDEAVAKAEEQFQKGKPDEALKTLQKAADQNPASPEARTALGRMQERVGNLDDAATTLAKAVELAASAAPSARSQALAALASLDLRHGSGRDALAHAEEAVKADANVAALAVLARAQARAADGAKALETADRAVQAGATSGAAHAARGEALLALHRNEDAVAAFRKALEVDPKLARARIGLAAALVAAGKIAEGIAEGKKASEADPKSGEAFAVLGSGILAENPNNWNDAIAQAQQGAFLEPKNPLVQTIVGRIFEAAGNVDQAASAYKRAVESDPGYVPAQSALVYVLVRRGDLDGALAAAQKLAADAPHSGEAQLQLGKVLLRKNDFVGAAGALEKAASFSPNVAEAHAMLGTSYQKIGRKADAAAAYKQATELAPTNLEYLTTYGLLLGMVDKGAEGAAILKKVIASPAYKSADAWLNLGWVYRNMKPSNTEESVKAYRKALEIDPKNAQAQLGIGWAYSYSRMWDESIAAFKKAIEMDSALTGEANNGIAWCFFFKRDMAQARAYLEKAQGAGRNDARLKAQIEKIEQLKDHKKAEEEIAKTEGPKQEVGPDIGQLANQLMNIKGKNPTARIAAAREICASGQPAVQYLKYSLTADPDVEVRIAAVECLARLGPKAKEAVPALQQALNYKPDVQLDADAAQMKRETREADLKNLIKDAIAKIQGK